LSVIARIGVPPIQGLLAMMVGAAPRALRGAQALEEGVDLAADLRGGGAEVVGWSACCPCPSAPAEPKFRARHKNRNVRFGSKPAML
jgi:hypothetical protein